MKKRNVKRSLSCLLFMAMVVTSLPTGSYVKAEANKKSTDSSYTFASDTVQAVESSAEDTEMQICITRSGNVREPSNMVLLSCDMNADYGEDYTLACDSGGIEREDTVTSMYTAFRDNRVISSYEEDNRAFADALLAQAGLSLEGENELVPLDGAGQEGSLANGAVEDGEQKGSAEDEMAGKENASVVKGLTDADGEGVHFYDSLSTLNQIGAVSSRTPLFFEAGERTKEITLTVKADKLAEYDESFLLGLVSPKAAECLLQDTEGIPDIPLKKGRDIAVTFVTIGDSAQRKPKCSVSVEKAEYTAAYGEEAVPVTFVRAGAVETFSTVVLGKEGKACGYFHFTPYQTVQEAELEAGTYQIWGYKDCMISGSKTVTVKAGKRNSGKKQGTVVDENDLDAVYEYDPLPDSSQLEDAKAADEKAAEQSGEETGTGKKAANKKAAGTWPNGNPDWFPEWANNNGITETADYISHAGQGESIFKAAAKSSGVKYCAQEYISKKGKEHHGKGIYNTWRMNTSGFLSSTYYNECIAYALNGGKWYDMTGIESIETKYYVDDTELTMTLDLGTDGQTEDYVKQKGVHDLKVQLDDKCQRTEGVTVMNDNYEHHDGADVYVMNALKFNKRTYQVLVDHSNKLSYVTKSGGIEEVAAETVSKDQYSYLKMGDQKDNNIVMNLNLYNNYPMAVTGYQFIDKNGGVIKNSFVQSTSDRIKFNKEFLKKYEKYCFNAKREGWENAYATFHIQPVVSKIPIEKENFVIYNGSKDSVYNPYRGELVLENKEKDLYQGDHVILSARDVQEGYTFSGVYVRRRKTESADWESSTQGVDGSGRVVFRLDPDYSYYELEPVFSGHEADTVTLSYAEGAREHGKLIAQDQDASTVALVSPEEYKLNTYVPLVAVPEEGYLACWYSGNRTYYGNTFYYQMDGNSKHNDIVVDFLKKTDVATASVDLEMKICQNQVNLRNSSFAADPVPIADADVTVVSGKPYQGVTAQDGRVVFQGFEGVIGGTYSMVLYQSGENRYRYVEFQFTGMRACDIKVPAFAGMAAYPNRVTARIDGTSSGQSYIDLTQTGEVEITVEVYRPDPATKLGEVGVSFYYSGEGGMAKQDYTIAQPDGRSDGGTSLGVYDTYTLKVSAMEIPNLSYLYVDVKSSYEVLQTQAGGTAGQMVTVDCDTGYVNTGYNFKTPNESSELAVLEEVPELPGLQTAGQDVSIPYIGAMDYGFSAKNGAYFVRQDDPNTGTWYLLAGYNVTSTWAKTMTDRYEGSVKTADALVAAQKQQRMAGDLNGGSSNLVSIPTKPIVNIAPTVSLKFVMKDQEDGGTQLVGYDAVLGLDELIVYNAPFTIYGVPCYVNLTFNGEEFFEVHAGGNNLGSKGVQNAITEPDKDTNMAYFIQAPNLDLTVKTGVGFNAFAGIYLSLGGNLKFNLEYTDRWAAGGYFYLRGGIGADLAIFSIEETVNIPGSSNQGFGDDEARSHIHGATAKSASLRTAKTGMGESGAAQLGGAGAADSDTEETGMAGAGVSGLMESLQEEISTIDEDPVFTVSRNRGKTIRNASKKESGELNAVLKPAGKNVNMKLIKLSGKKVMAITLEDNGASEDSLNYLSAAYAISSDGGKTWEKKDNISKSDKLQWHVECYKLKDRFLLTWSEGDLDHAVGKERNADSAFNLQEVAKALTAFNLKGRYFDLDGNPLGESFMIAEDENVAMNSLDVVENEDKTVDIYYERRAYSQNVATLTELMSQEQTICRTAFDSEGKAVGEAKRFLVQGQDGKDTYRVTELEAFSHNGVEGQVVVLDGDGKLVKETEDGTEPSIDDRQVYLRIVSDKNGVIPSGTLVPVTEAGTCAQHIVLAESGEHLYLFWNENGTIMSMNDFLPGTQAEYEAWKEHIGNFGKHAVLSDENSLTPDKEFRVAINEKGKGILLWKDEDGGQNGEDKLVNQVYAGTFTTGQDGIIASVRGPIALSGFLAEIDNLDVQVLDDGQIVYGYTRLDGASQYESQGADAVVQGVEEACDVQITTTEGEQYPQPGEAYTSDVTLWNTGMADAENLTVSASGAFHGTASLAELTEEEAQKGGSGTGQEQRGTLGAGQMRKVSLPVTAAASLHDGDEVVYTVSQNGKVLSAFKDTVHLGAYMVPEEMASVISIPGTDDYQVSLPVMNQGNLAGTTDVHIYTYEQGVQPEKEEDIKQWDCKDGTVLNPGDRTVVSYVVKGAACTDSSISMIGLQTGDGYGQAVEGMLPDRVEAVGSSANQPEQPDNPAEPGITPRPDNTAQPGGVKKGDRLTLGSGNTRAVYKVTSSKAVSYYKAKLSAGRVKAKVPASVKIAGRAYKVTAVAAGAFKGNKKLKMVTIGKNVKKIGKRAFAGCSKLKKLTINSTRLTKKAVKGSLKGSRVQSMAVPASRRKKYKKYFTKKNAGRRVRSFL